jgi:hypothetical protein
MAMNGMMMPPSMVQPFYQTTGSAIRGMMGMPAGPGYTGAESSRAGRRYMRERMGDMAVGAFASLPELGSGVFENAAWMMPGVGIVNPAALGVMAAGWGISEVAGMPFKGPSQDYKMARQMEMEMRRNPSLNRFHAGFSQLNNFAKETRVSLKSRYAAGENVGMSEFMDVTSAGIAGGMFDNTRNFEEFGKTTKQYYDATKRISKILKVTAQEGMQLLTELKNMGYYDLKGQMNQMTSMVGAANLSGMGVADVMRISGTGAQLAGGKWGAGQATSLVGSLGYAYSRGGAASDRIRMMGGVEQASLLAVQQTTNTLQNTAFGTMMLAQQMGGGGSLAAISSRMSADPAQIARLLDANSKSQLQGKMGDYAGVQIVNQMAKALKDAGMAVTPEIIAMKTGMDSNTVRNLMTQGSKEAIRANIRSQYAGSTSIEGPERSGWQKALGIVNVFNPFGYGGYWNENVKEDSGFFSRMRASYVQGAEAGRGYGQSMDRLSEAVSLRSDRLPKVRAWGERMWETLSGEEGVAYNYGSKVKINESARRRASQLARGIRGGSAESLSAEMKKWAVANLGGDISSDIERGGQEKLLNLLSSYSAGEDKSQEKLKGYLLASGKSTEEVSEIMGRLTSASGKAGLSEYVAKREAKNIVESRRYRSPDSGALRGRGFSSNLLQNWESTGDLDSFKGLYQEYKKMSDVQRSKLGKDAKIANSLLWQSMSGVQGNDVAGAWDLLRSQTTEGMSLGASGEAVNFKSGTVNISAPTAVYFSGVTESVIKEARTDQDGQAAGGR